MKFFKTNDKLVSIKKLVLNQERSLITINKVWKSPDVVNYNVSLSKSKIVSFVIVFPLQKARQNIFVFFHFFIPLEQKLFWFQKHQKSTTYNISSIGNLPFLNSFFCLDLKYEYIPSNLTQEKYQLKHGHFYQVFRDNAMYAWK